jgi:hypothetical protein
MQPPSFEGIVPERKLIFKGKALKRGTGMKKLVLIFLSVFLFVATCNAEDLQQDGVFSIVTDATYRMGTGDSEEMAKALALFSAKMKAVTLAAKYLTHKGVLAHYEKRQNEIFHLVPRQIASVVLDERFDPLSRSHYVKIRSEISSIDFIRAEVEDAALKKREEKFSYDREMTQSVGSEIEPGKELSRVYRYIRKGEWRIAIIFSDHLEKKYANWGEVLLAKAIALYGTGNETGMLQALDRACGLGNEEACNEIKSLESGSE